MPQLLCYVQHSYSHAEILHIKELIGKGNKKGIAFMHWRKILCTLYGAVDFLIVPSKGLYG